MSQELQTVEPNTVTIANVAPRSVKEIREQRQIIESVLNDVMQEGVHYDRVPGTKNKTLLKPGTEKIMSTFRLAADPEVEDISGPDEIRYRVRGRLLAPDGTFVGTGVGECSSMEEKFKWREAVCEEEWNEVKANDTMRARKKWKKNFKGDRKPYQVAQVRTEPADQANTVLKMAKKRALSDAVYTATACSDIFDPDTDGDENAYARGSAHANRDNYRPPAKTPQKETAGDVDVKMLTSMLEDKAEEGLDALNQVWSNLNEQQKTAVGKDWFRIKKLCPETAEGG